MWQKAVSMNTDVHSNCSVHVIANIPPPIINPHHTEQNKRSSPAPHARVLHPDSGYSLWTRLGAVPLEVKAGRTRMCQLKVTEQLLSACGPLWVAANFSSPPPPAPDIPASLTWSVPWLPCAVSLQRKQPSMANCWNPGREKQREGRMTAVSSLYSTLTPCGAFAHQHSWHSDHSAYKYDSAPSWQLLIHRVGLHPRTLPSWVFLCLGVKKRREKHSYEASGLECEVGLYCPVFRPFKTMS